MPHRPGDEGVIQTVPYYQGPATPSYTLDRLNRALGGSDRPLGPEVDDYGMYTAGEGELYDRMRQDDIRRKQEWDAFTLPQPLVSQIESGMFTDPMTPVDFSFQRYATPPRTQQGTLGSFQDALPEPFDEEERRKKEQGLPYSQLIIDPGGQYMRGSMVTPPTRARSF